MANICETDRNVIVNLRNSQKKDLQMDNRTFTVRNKFLTKSSEDDDFYDHCHDDDDNRV